MELDGSRGSHDELSSFGILMVTELSSMTLGGRGIVRDSVYFVNSANPV